MNPFLHSFRNPLPEYALGTGSVDAKAQDSAFFLDKPEHTYLRAKLASSLAHSRGEARASFEVFADDAQTLPLREMKAMIDRLACVGVNRPVPPTPEIAQRPHFDLLADYATRLSHALCQGTHRAQVAVLWPRVNGIPVKLSGFARSYLDILAACLLEEHLDYDILDEESIRRATAVDERLHVAEEDYELLVLPPMTSMPCATAAKIKEFIEDGGKLLAAGFLPVEDADGEKHDRVRSIFAGLFGVDPVGLLESQLSGTDVETDADGSDDAGAILFSSREPGVIVPVLRSLISRLIKPDVSARLGDGECRDIGCTRRVFKDGELFFFANHSAEPREVQLSMRCSRAPHKLDPETGSAVALPNCTQRGGRTLLLHKFEAHGSLLVYFGDQPALAVERPGRDTDGDDVLLADEWEVSAGDSGVSARAQTVDLPEMGDGRVFLIAREPVDVVEFVVNGSSAGVRAWPPFEVEVSHLIQPGPNRIELRMTGSPADWGGARLMIC